MKSGQDAAGGQHASQHLGAPGPAPQGGGVLVASGDFGFPFDDGSQPGGGPGDGFGGFLPVASAPLVPGARHCQVVGGGQVEQSGGVCQVGAVVGCGGPVLFWRPFGLQGGQQGGHAGRLRLIAFKKDFFAFQL